MRAADAPSQRPPDAKILIVDEQGRMRHAARAQLPHHLRAGDLLVANDAATIPASLSGRHEPTGAPIEVRLAGRRSLKGSDVHEFTAIVFGSGDHRSRTEDRPAPPELRRGDVLTLGRVRATVLGLLDHPRLIALGFEGSPGAVWAGIAHHGKPIQYAHIEQTLDLWDVWTRLAALPVAFESPSASFLIDWHLLSQLKEHGIGFATLTHATGISSTGDALLDARLPFDEPYHLPGSTVLAITRTLEQGGRIVALGTSVTRAIEHAAQDGAIRSGGALATQHIGAYTTLRVVGAIVTGIHERGGSHYQLLRAFAGDALLRRVTAEFEREGYRTHEFGDSVLLARQPQPISAPADAGRRYALLSATAAPHRESSRANARACPERSRRGSSVETSARGM